MYLKGNENAKCKECKGEMWRVEYMPVPGNEGIILRLYCANRECMMCENPIVSMLIDENILEALKND